jgi:threonine aldolase
MLALGGLVTSSFSLPLPKNAEKRSSTVKFTRDGLDLQPDEYQTILNEVLGKNGISTDQYIRGGIVEELEDRFARMLGKEGAVFFPTGTLANQIAIREQAGKNRRVVVQKESHIYNDSGDCLQNLSGLAVLPLGAGKTTFDIEELVDTYKRTSQGRVKTRIGVVSLETPVRRKDNRYIEPGILMEIIDLARANGSKLHMDGARLYNMAVHTGISPSDLCKEFDTVYVSMYKNFNAPAGAILAGKDSFVKNLYHTRRMFGGSLAQAWPLAAIANHYAEGFMDDYKEAIRRFDVWKGLINKSDHLTIETIPQGTNVFYLKTTKGTDLKGFKNTLVENSIELNPPDNELPGFVMKINPTLNRIAPTDLARAFLDASRKNQAPARK